MFYFPIIFTTKATKISGQTYRASSPSAAHLQLTADPGGIFEMRT